MEGKGDTDEGTSEVGQEAVVVAFASTEAVALGSECHAWDDGEVDGLIVGEESTEGFLDAEGETCGKRVFPFVAVKSEGISYDSGEEDGLALGIKSTDEVVCVDFIGQGMIEEDCADAILLCDAFK